MEPAEDFRKTNLLDLFLEGIFCKKLSLTKIFLDESKRKIIINSLILTNQPSKNFLDLLSKYFKFSVTFSDFPKVPLLYIKFTCII